jgi:hypothetical protein
MFTKLSRFNVHVRKYAIIRTWLDNIKPTRSNVDKAEYDSVQILGAGSFGRKILWHEIEKANEDARRVSAARERAWSHCSS